MTPELRNEFEISWKELQPRLRVMLAARRVGMDRHEDLLQETALRLYRMWERVDRSKPSWPLAKTIALNLLRDEYRTRRVTQSLEDSPEQPFDYDLEAQGIARLELERVHKALSSLTELQRRALLVEIGVLPTGEPCSGDKMVRMRARKRLVSLLEDVSAVVSLRWVKLPDLLQGAGLFRGAGNAAIACFACIFGASVAAIGVGPLGEEASARPHFDAPVSRPAQIALAEETHTRSAILTRDSLREGTDAGTSVGTSATAKKKRSNGVSSSGAPESQTAGSGDSKLSGSSDVDVPSVPSGEQVPDAPSVPVPSAPTIPGSGPEESEPPALDVERAVSTAAASLTSLDQDPPG